MAKIMCSSYRLELLNPTNNREQCPEDAVALVDYVCVNNHEQQKIPWCLAHLKRGASAQVACKRCNDMGLVIAVTITHAEHLLPPVGG